MRRSDCRPQQSVGAGKTTTRGQGWGLTSVARRKLTGRFSSPGRELPAPAPGAIKGADARKNQSSGNNGDVIVKRLSGKTGKKGKIGKVDGAAASTGARQNCPAEAEKNPEKIWYFRES